MGELKWTDDRENSSYASFEFGPETVYYSLDLSDAKLDLWTAETGVICSEHGPTEIHKCIGRDNAKAAVAVYHENRLASLLVTRPAPSRNEVLEEADKQTLLDPDAVHLNMLRGTIAKPTLAQIIHIYGADTVERALKTSGNDE